MWPIAVVHPKPGQGRRRPACRRPALVCRFAVLGLLTIGPAATAQDLPADRRILSVARELMTDARYAALITVDSTGAAQARTIEPFAPDGRLVVWFGTNPRTRKIAEITRDPRVTLYYFSTRYQGYVTIRGRARLVDDSVEKARRWKEAWAAFYPDRDADFLLVEVVPERIEVVSPAHGITGDPTTWRPPASGPPGGR